LRRRDIYLKIEKLPAYSPVAPDDAEHHLHRRDCMRNHGHEDGTIPQAEVDRRRLDAIVYREYLDAAYTIPQSAPLIATDSNEPRAERRIPGAIIYTEPGERLYVHVLNEDDEPHSLHVHGLVYGVDSDGSWPFGVHRHEDGRSDQICPGESWCYVYDVTEETIGVWPFHSHHMHIAEATNRGLFGGIVVRDPDWCEVDYEVPFFFHLLEGTRAEAIFDSGTLNGGDPPFSHTFTAEGTYEYYCRFHPMRGTVRVTAGGAASAAVSILDSAPQGPRYDPLEVTVAPGATVTWTHAGNQPHTVTDAGGAGLSSGAINGRVFVGNTPTIVAESGKRIRWYVFNLNLGELWHNFHIHGARWRVGNENVDTRSIGPAESFMVETTVPDVILPPLSQTYPHGSEHEHGGSDREHGGSDHDHESGDEHPHEHGVSAHEHGPGHEHPHESHHEPAESPGHDHPGDSGHHPHPRRVTLRGDFLVHCHVEMHMMEGMAALVRAVQEVDISAEHAHELGFVLPLHDGGHECPEVDHHACGGDEGTWESLPDAPIFVVHGAVLRTGKVLLWSGTAEVGDPLESRVWDPALGTMTTQTYGEDLFCAGHAFLPDGRLCVAGGAPQNSMDSTHIFDPVAETWTKVADMNQARWYPTVLTLSDGRILAASGTGASEIETYDPATNTWTLVAGATRTFSELYPSLHLLPSGQIFYSRAGWSAADTGQTQTAYLTLTGPNSGTWTSLGQQQFPDRQEGTAVIQIDTTVTPPATRVTIIGGGVTGAQTARNPLTAETIDLTTLAPPPAWTRTADMNFARTNVSGTLLPDGTILAVGGQRNGKWNSDPQHVLEAEIYDPATDVWTPTTPMAHPRQYHSIAVLLPDGRVLTAGGVDPSPGIVERDQRSMEIFSPSYLSRGTRPTIGSAPATVAYSATIAIDTPDAAEIDSVVLLRPCSMTHHTDAGQRHIKLPILSRGATTVTVQGPANGNIAPPGHYMLFILDTGAVPSEARFVQVS